MVGVPHDWCGVTNMIAEAVVARKLETTGHEILKAITPPNNEQSRYGSCS